MQEQEARGHAYANMVYMCLAQGAPFPYERVHSCRAYTTRYSRRPPQSLSDISLEVPNFQFIRSET